MPAPLATPVWGDPDGAENPGPLRGTVSVDLCVIGLGGSGLAAVGRALEAGATVAGVDAGPVAGGAAGRNGGFLLAGGALFHNDAVAAWGEERAVGIYQESLRELDRLEAELGEPIVRRVGSLRIPASAEEEQHCADEGEDETARSSDQEPRDDPAHVHAGDAKPDRGVPGHRVRAGQREARESADDEPEHRQQDQEEQHRRSLFDPQAILRESPYISGGTANETSSRAGSCSARD